MVGFFMASHTLICRQPKSAFQSQTHSLNSKEEYTKIRVYISSHSQLVRPTNYGTHIAVSEKKYTLVTWYTSSNSNLIQELSFLTYMRLHFRYNTDALGFPSKFKQIITLDWM